MGHKSGVYEITSTKSYYSECSGNAYWTLYSEDALDNAEKKILSYVETPHKCFYVDIESVVGESDKIWTLVMNERSQKTPIVLIHGMGAGLALWCPNLDAIAATRPVYALDLLGFGRSSRPQFATEALEVEAQWADSIEAWRRKLNLSQFVLLGHSLGGYIATAYALKYSERVRHLIVADPWGYNEPTPYSKHSLWSHLFITSTQLLNPMWAVRAAGPAGRWLVSKTRPDIPEKFKILPDAETLIPDYIYQCNSQNPSGEAAFRTMDDQYVFAKHPMSRRIHELHPALPFTGIYGDKYWMPCAADVVKKMRPNSSHYTKILKDAGHFVYLDNPEEFNNTVLETCAYADKCDPQIAQRLQANKRVERLHAIRDDQSSINISKSYQSHNSKRRVKIAKIGNKSQNEMTKSNLCKILCVSLYSSFAVMLAVMQTKCGYTILSVSP